MDHVKKCADSMRGGGAHRRLCVSVSWGSKYVHVSGEVRTLAPLSIFEPCYDSRGIDRRNKKQQCRSWDRRVRTEVPVVGSTGTNRSTGRGIDWYELKYRSWDRLV